MSRLIAAEYRRRRQNATACRGAHFGTGEDNRILLCVAESHPESGNGVS